MKSKNEMPKSTIKGISQGYNLKEVMEALKVGQTLNDAALRKVPAAELNTDLSVQMNEIMANKDKAKRFAETFFDQINTDEEPYDKIGYYMAKAIRTDSVEDLLVAICGWSAGTLVRLANDECV